MKTILHIIRPLVLTALVLANFEVSTRAQEVSIPDPGLNAAIHETLQKPNGPLTQQDLLGLTNLSAISRNITSLQGLEAAHNLSTLLLDDNRLTNLSFPDVLPNLTRLSVLDLSENPLTNLPLPGGLTNLTKLRVENGGLNHLTLPAAGLTRLTELHLGFNQLPGLTLPADMTNLSVLSLFQNQLTSFTLPAGLTNLTGLFLQSNQLTNLTLPPDLNHLTQLDLPGNKLASLDLPPGLTSLAFLNLTDNQLTNITLPPDMRQLIGLFVGGNPLMTFVLSEPLAATGLASVVQSLQNQGVAVFTYPLVAQLVRPLMLTGAFKFGITGPPGVYTVLGSTNLAVWSAVGVATNPLGSVNFIDVTANASPQKFCRVLLQVPPADMVFIPPNE